MKKVQQVYHCTKTTRNNHMVRAAVFVLQESLYTNRKKTFYMMRQDPEGEEKEKKKKLECLPSLTWGKYSQNKSGTNCQKPKSLATERNPARLNIKRLGTVWSDPAVRVAVHRRYAAVTHLCFARMKSVAKLSHGIWLPVVTQSQSSQGRSAVGAEPPLQCCPTPEHGPSRLARGWTEPGARRAFASPIHTLAWSTCTQHQWREYLRELMMMMMMKDSNYLLLC